MLKVVLLKRKKWKERTLKGETRWHLISTTFKKAEKAQSNIFLFKLLITNSYMQFTEINFEF